MAVSPPPAGKIRQTIGAPATISAAAHRSRSVGYELRVAASARSGRRCKTHEFRNAQLGDSKPWCASSSALIGSACGVSIAAGLSARRPNLRRNTRRKSTVVRFDERQGGDTPTSSKTSHQVWAEKIDVKKCFGHGPSSLDDLPTLSPSSAARSHSVSPKARPMSPDSPRSKAAPSRAELGRLFDALDMGMGRLGHNEVMEAVLEISDKYDLGIECSDIDRLMTFFESYEPDEQTARGDEEEASVGRYAFVKGLRALSVPLAQVRKQNMTASSLRTVVVAAFEEFDLNGDGVISMQELSSAASVLGLQLSELDVEILHRFIAPSETKQIEKDDIPVWEKVANAFDGVVHQQQKRYAVHSVDTIMKRMSKAPQMPESLEEMGGWLTQHVAEIAEHWADAFELAVSAAGMGVAAQHAAAHLNLHDLASADWHSAAPFLTFVALGAMDFAKELDEMALQDMNVDEALLYAQVFKNKGFSQVQFRQLLACKSCQWSYTERGDVLREKEGTLQFLVRGRAQARSCGVEAKAVPGTVIGAASFYSQQDSQEPLVITAKDTVVSVSWNIDELHDRLDHDPELAISMDKVLAAGLSSNLKLIRSMQTQARRQQAAKNHPEAERLMAQMEEEMEAALSDGSEGELRKLPSLGGRQDATAFLEEVRWLRLQLLLLRRRVSNPVLGWDFSPVVDVALGWMNTMASQLRCDAERRGLLRTWYGVKQVVDAMSLPKSVQAFNFWHSLDEVINVNNVISDYSGAFLLVYGAWHHLSTMNGCSPDDFDPAQFMTLLAVCGVRVAGNMFKKNEDDLREEEAALYAAGGFKEAGFTPGEFHHLLAGGGARVEKLQAGEVKVVGLTDPQLHMCVEGQCLVLGNNGHSGNSIAAREFLGSDALGVQDPMLENPRMQCRLEATEETTILVWDVAQLKPELCADSKLRMKMLRMVTLSMADKLLRDSMAGAGAKADDEQKPAYVHA